VRNDIEQQIRDFIAENFMFRAGLSDIAADESLLEAGIVDSTGVLELVAFLETAFGIAIGDDDIVPENLDSIGALTAFVAGKLGGADATTSLTAAG
jgi:acyl carrier protein